MKDLLNFLLKEITGSSDFSVEQVDEEDKINFNVVANPEIIGLIIGKGGKTIKAIQTLIRIRGRLENKSAFVNVAQKEEAKSSKTS